MTLSFILRAASRSPRGLKVKTARLVSRDEAHNDAAFYIVVAMHIGMPVAWRLISIGWGLALKRRRW